MPRRIAPGLGPTLLALAAALPYAHTLDVPFTFDDQPCIVRNLALRPPAGDGQPAPPSICAPPTRALGEATLALNYRLGGLAPAGYHLFNLAVHLATSLLVYALLALAIRALRVGGAPAPEGGAPGTEELLPLFAALLFAVHPLQTQAVTYVVQRFASLATLLYVLAVVLYLVHRLSGTRAGRGFAWLGALLATVAAMFTKEIAFTVPLALVLAEVLLLSGPWPRRALGLAPFLATLAIIPATLLGAGSLAAGGASVDASLRGLASNALMTRGEYLLSQLPVLVRTLGMLALPVGQTVDHDVPLARSLLEGRVLGSLLTLAAVAGLGAAALVRSGRAGAAARVPLRLVAFGIGWFFLTASVESSLVPLPDLLVEHRAYLPSLGFFTAAVAALLLLREWLRARWPGAAAAVVPVLSIAVVALGAAAVARNEIWRDPVALWTEAATRGPGRARPLLEVGRLELEAGRFAEAERALLAAIAAAPGEAAPRSTLGVVLRRQGRVAEAAQRYREALARGPEHADVHYNLGLLLAGQGQLDEALASLREAVRLRPESAEIRNALGATLAQAGRLEEAVAEFRTALRIDPASASARRNLSRALTVSPGR